MSFLPAPLILTPSPDPTFTTVAPIVSLSGTFASGYSINTILVNESSLNVTISGYAWDYAANLVVGTNTFTVIASDPSGDMSAGTTITITCNSTTNTVSDYLSYLTSEHFSQPDLNAVITANVSPMVQLQAVLTTLLTLFDLGTPPVGNQLDIIGQWVGSSRSVNIGGVLTVLDDSFFLQIILARLLANTWDGTTESLYYIWNFVFPDIALLIQDNLDMTYDIAIVGVVPDPTSEALLTEGYLLPKPEGIQITNYYIPVNTGAIFSWDMNTSTMAGWGSGSWTDIVPG